VSVLRLHPDDNLIVALRDLAAGETVKLDGTAWTLPVACPAKHKFAAEARAPGQPLRLYGVLVGTAAAPIACGEIVTPANLHHAAAPLRPRHPTPAWTPPAIEHWIGRTFAGYHREDGRVGTANHWLVVPLVFCENRNLQTLREVLVRDLGYPTGRGYDIDLAALVHRWREGASPAELAALPILRDGARPPAERVFRHVDGIKFLAHTLGCGGTREDATALCELLAGYLAHPNCAGATVLSLGCQNAQVELLRAALARRAPRWHRPLLVLEQQAAPSEPAFIADAVRRTFAGLAEADSARRSPAPLAHLTLGLECGGSDGFSGLSANPALGHASDLLVALGGTSVLAEFPELHGVEQWLIDRCVDDAVAEKFADLMRRYAARALAVGSSLSANPSPGNIRDGLVTDAIKSAGAARKAGTAPVVDVLDYTEPVRRPGLNLLCTPGNDVESTTALAGSGCNLIAFTTGLGTPTGNPLTPTVKIASNSALARRMPDLIDFDAGPVIDGAETIAECGERMLELFVRVASGETVPHAVRLGQDDFIPWKRGVSL
jgi:altronate hydrolase